MLLALTQLRIVYRKQRFFSSAASVLSRRSDFSLKTLNFFQNSNHVLNGSTGEISRPICRRNAGSAVPSGVPHDDGMSRYPSFTSSRGVLRGLDYFGTVVFASSGAITAASCGLDLLGCVALGTITAVGGGTIRDVVILGRAPFWSGPNGETEYLWMSLAAALAAFFLYPILGSDVFDSTAMNAADAVGLGAFCVIGAQNGIRAGLAWPLCILCGVSTGTFGGATRDVLARRPVRIFHSYAELYASVAGVGAVAYMAVRALGAKPPVRIAAGISVAVALRYLACKYDLKLPSWESMGHSQHVRKF